MADWTDIAVQMAHLGDGIGQIKGENKCLQEENKFLRAQIEEGRQTRLLVNELLNEIKVLKNMVIQQGVSK